MLPPTHGNLSLIPQTQAVILTDLLSKLRVGKKILSKNKMNDIISEK